MSILQVFAKVRLETECSLCILRRQQEMILNIFQKLYLDIFQKSILAINNRRRIEDQKDADELIEELKQLKGNLHEEIISQHNFVRTPHGDEIINSKVQIVDIMTLYCSIVVQNFE